MGSTRALGEVEADRGTKGDTFARQCVRVDESIQRGDGFTLEKRHPGAR